jgi:putative ABC transport system substrate-binding protein
MRRRQFIMLLGGAAAWPLAARAQHAGKPPAVGLLGANTASAQRRWTDALVGRLRELGWSEGHNLTIEYRWADGRTDQLPGLAADLVARKVDVIVATGTPPVLAVKHATSIIPIVFVGIGDPVGTGLVNSLARPGGNATGLSQQGADTPGKRLELLREAVGGLRRVAVLVNVGNPYISLEMKEVALAASKLGLDVVTVDIRRVEDIVPGLIAIRGQVQALYVPGDALTFTHRVRVVTVALAGRLPTIHNLREHVEAGGLMSYGPSFVDLHRRSADYVDKILRGTKPADIPVEQPTKFDLFINLVTARSLGLDIPPTLLARADEVIE